MSETLKTYSLIIAWDDRDEEQGTFADTVRAVDHEEAELIVRQHMAESEMANFNYTEAEVADHEYGSVLECSEGAIWKAADLEKALRLSLRALVAAYGEPSPERLPTESELGREAILEARKLIAEIDGIA